MFSSEAIWDTERGTSLYKISSSFKNDIPKIYTRANVCFNGINSSKILFLDDSHVMHTTFCLLSWQSWQTFVTPELCLYWWRAVGVMGRPFPLSGFSSNTGCISQDLFYRLWEMEEKNEIGWHLLGKKWYSECQNLKHCCGDFLWWSYTLSSKTDIPIALTVYWGLSLVLTEEWPIAEALCTKTKSYRIKTKKQINGKEIIYEFVFVVFVSEKECMQIRHRKIKKL